MKNYKLLFIALLAGIVTSAQNIGIGTTSPTDQLHTTGTVRLQKYAGATTRLLQIDSSGRLIATAAGPVFSSNTAQAIPDNGCATATGISSSITISGQPNVPVQSSRISVKVNITHPYVGDLKIYLFPPGGSVLNLADGNGGSGDNFTNTIFTDQAGASISAGTAPFTGQYKPMANVAGCNIFNPAIGSFATIGFGSIIPNGTWTLKVYDAAGTDAGVLNDWSISFTGPESIITAAENNFIPKFAGGNLTASNIYQPAGSGNIGIGTTNPSYILDINGRARLMHNGNTAGIWYNKSNNTEEAFTGMLNDSTYGFFGNSGWRVGFDIKNALMGIGVMDPSAPLSFASTTGNKIALWGDASGGHYGLGIQGSLLQVYSAASNTDIVLGYGSSTAFTENMRVKGNGNVGIGTNNPSGKLDVAANNGTQSGYFNQLGSGRAIFATSVSGTAVDAYSATGTAVNAFSGPSSSTAPVVNVISTSSAPAIVATGKVKIIDGTQAAGKVFTSDAGGTGSWTNAAFGNTERFQFKISAETPNGVITLETVYNYGTTTASSSQAADEISLFISKAGLYHFDINTIQDCSLDYSVTSSNPHVQFISYGLTGNRMDGYAPFYRITNVLSYSSFDKSYDVYVASPSTFKVSSFRLPQLYNFKVTVTGHLISE